jgi:hypothetical protein
VTPVRAVGYVCDLERCFPARVMSGRELADQPDQPAGDHVNREMAAGAGRPVHQITTPTAVVRPRPDSAPGAPRVTSAHPRGQGLIA